MFLAVAAVVSTLGVTSPLAAQEPPTIVSELPDYAPGSTVNLTGANWAAGEPVHVTVEDISGGDWVHESSPDPVASGDGSLAYTFDLPNAVVALFQVTATGPISGTATTTFTDAIGPSVDWTQCRNDNGGGSPTSGGSSNDGDQDPCNWVNGNLGASNSIYAEGEVVPQRAIRAVGGAGAHHTTIDHSFYDASKGAMTYDLFATADASLGADLTPCNDLPGGGNWPGITTASCQALFSARQVVPIPTESTFPNAVTGPLTYPFVAGAEADALADGVTRNLWISCGVVAGTTLTVDGTTQCTGVQLTILGHGASNGTLLADQDGPPTAEDYTQLRVAFTTPQPNTMVAIWVGGHLAKASYWNNPTKVTDPAFRKLGAASAAGSSFHHRLIGWDEANAIGNQDNQLQANVVVPPGSITIVKDDTSNSSTPFTFNGASPLSPSSFVLSDDGTNATGQDRFTYFDLTSGTYNVSELLPSGWSLDSIVCSSNTGALGGSTFGTTKPTASVNLATGDDVTCTFTNSPIRGSLQVTKVVNWNGVTPEPGQTFEICITGPSYPAPTQQNGGCQLADHDGGTLSWSNLIPGTYQVNETDPGANWIVGGSGSQVVVPLTGGTVTAPNITNTRKLGGLSVTKVVNWNGVTPDAAQTFTICITGPSYPTPTVQNGGCKLFDHDGETLTWSNLIPGNYTVLESDPGVAWTISGDQGGVVAVPANGAPASTTPQITNTRKLGSLKVTKTVNWNGITPDGEQFTICITGPSYPAPTVGNGGCKTVGQSGGDLTWSNLIPGSYTVTEIDPGAEWTVVVSGSPATVPVDGGQATASVTNTRKLGSLKVTKTVNWNGITPDGEQFTICITGPSYPAPTVGNGGCKTVGQSGGDLTWSNLIPGSYTVTEIDPGTEWAVQVTDSPAAVPVDGGQATAGVTNTRKLGSLKVTKTLNWNGITPDGEVFTICITGPSYPAPTVGNGGCQVVGQNGGDLTWTGLIPGDYAVSENDPGAEWTVVVSGSPATVPVDGGQDTALVTNTRKLGSLQVTKVVDWNGVTPDQSQTFTICITGPSYPAPTVQNGGCKVADFDGSTLTWSNLIPGNYTVAENDPGSSWVVSGGQAGVTAVPVDGGQGNAPAITNTRKRGGLMVAKIVDWNGITPDQSQTFTICITGPSFPAPTVQNGGCQTTDWDGGTLTWSNLIPGDYTVAENAPGSSWTVTGGQGDVVAVPANGGTVEADAITNTRKLGSLKVTKTVIWNGVTPDGEQFTICITGPSFPAPTVGNGGCKVVGQNGGDLTWSNLVPGSYTVSELDPGAEWTVAVSDSPATVPTDGGQDTALVTNTRKLGSLQVTKVVDWNGVTPDQAQTFTICITGPSVPAPTVQNGGCQVADFDGATLSWSNLIPGSYDVAENPPGSSWTITGGQNVSTAVPANGGTATAPAITNTRKLGSLQVTKVVDWNGVTPDQAQTFTICITGASYPAPTVQNGGCQVADFDGATLSWSNLIPGGYTVSETDPGSAWTISGGQNVSTEVPANGGTATAPAITNTRKLGSLEVTKTVDWNGITPDGEVFEICISGPSYPDGDEEGACQEVGQNGGLLAWDDLIPGTYSVVETDPGDEWVVVVDDGNAVVPVDGGGGSASVTNTRKLGSLEVTKTVDWNGITPDGEVFEICISGPSYPDGDEEGACQEVGQNGGLLAWDDLIPGTYSVVETDPGDEWVVVVDDGNAVVPVDGGGGSASVTNTRKLGSLEVTKTVVWNGVPVDEAQTFTLCISGPTFPEGDEQGACQSVDFDGGTLVWDDLIPGDYVVTEPGVGVEWTVAIDDEGATVPVDGGGGTASVTNTRKLGGLTVDKVVVWNGVAPVEDQSFTICITGATFPAPTVQNGGCQTIGAQGGTLTWTDLVPGPYTVSELAPGAEWAVEVGGDATATVPVDGSTVDGPTVTNTRKLGSLVATKNVNWNGVTPDDGQTFTICITGPSHPTPTVENGGCQTIGAQGGTLTWAELIPGDYTVTENDPGSNWTVVGNGVVTTVAVDGSTASALAITNTRKLGSLVVTKIVDWNGAATDAAQTFTICITGPSHPTPTVQNGGCQVVDADGATLTWSNLVPGTYTVTEVAPGAGWEVLGGDGATAVVPADGGTVTAPDITNRRTVLEAVVSKPPVQPLAFTGSNADLKVVLALLMLGLGVGLLVIRRRRLADAA